MLAPDWRFLALANFIGGLKVFRFPASSALLADSMPPALRGRGFAFIMAVPGLMANLVPHEERGRTLAVVGRGMLMINYRGGGGGGPGMGFLLTFPSIVGLMAGGYVFDAGPSLPWVILGGMALVNAVILAFLIKPGEAS